MFCFYLRAYQVIVSEDNADQKGNDSFDESKLTNYNKAKETGLSYYIAAELIPRSGKFPKKLLFTVGDGKKYRGYQNVELQMGKTYKVYQRALTKDDHEEVFIY